MDTPTQNSPAKKTSNWFARLDPAAKGFDRARALTIFQLATAVMAVALAIFYTATTGFWGNQDPVAPLAVLAAAVMVLQIVLTRHHSFAIRYMGLHASLYLLIGTYIVWRYLLDNPFTSTAYVFMLVLSGVLFGQFRQSLAVIGFAIAWTFATLATGLVVGAEDVPSTFMGCGLAIVVAWLIDKERQAAAANAQRWQQAHGDLQSVIASAQDAIYSIGADGNILFANQAGQDWCDHVTHCQPETPRFWMHLPQESRSLFEQCFHDALVGRRSSVVIKARMGGRLRNWEVTCDPHIEWEGAIVTVRDVTDRQEQQAAVTLGREQARIEVLNLISHELNTPLMPILLESHVLAQRLKESNAHEDHARVESIERNARRAIAMVRELIERSHATAHGPQTVATHENSDNDPPPRLKPSDPDDPMAP